MNAENTAYRFRISKINSNIRVRDCEHCGKRTKQMQAQDAGGKFVEMFRCQSSSATPCRAKKSVRWCLVYRQCSPQFL